jgi:uncharacterized protein YcfL
MKRILFAVLLAATLAACSSNDKRVNAEEAQSVYMTTRLVPDLTTGRNAYVGPHMDTMDDENTYQTYNLASEANSQGVNKYQLVVLLTYYSNYRYYNAANVNNKPAAAFKTLSREEGACNQQGCAFKELMGIEIPGDFLQQHADKGFEVAISSKAGNSTVLYVPGPYIKGFLMAVKGKKN